MHMQRCPNCRARYRGEENCPRCEMELTFLIRLEAKVRQMERAAVHRMLENDFCSAQAILQRALGLQATPMVVSLLGFAKQWERRTYTSYIDEV